MVLKHRDTDVLRFDWAAPFGVKNVELNGAAERFLPLAFRDRVAGKDGRHIKALQNSGELRRVGSDKNVLWQVVEKAPGQ